MTWDHHHHQWAVKREWVRESGGKRDGGLLHYWSTGWAHYQPTPPAFLPSYHIDRYMTARDKFKAIAFYSSVHCCCCYPTNAFFFNYVVFSLVVVLQLHSELNCKLRMCIAHSSFALLLWLYVGCKSTRWEPMNSILVLRHLSTHKYLQRTMRPFNGLLNGDR